MGKSLQFLRGRSMLCGTCTLFLIVGIDITVAGWVAALAVVASDKSGEEKPATIRIIARENGLSPSARIATMQPIAPVGLCWIRATMLGEIFGWHAGWRHENRP
jgi:hypothetical protein